jgi:hypothetical protein
LAGLRSVALHVSRVDYAAGEVECETYRRFPIEERRTSRIQSALSDPGQIEAVSAVGREADFAGFMG